MATSALPRYHQTPVEARRSPSSGVLPPITACPPSSFPDKFQDFFTALTEDADDMPSMLEDKLIPRWVRERLCLFLAISPTLAPVFTSLWQSVTLYVHKNREFLLVYPFPNIISHCLTLGKRITRNKIKYVVYIICTKFFSPISYNLDTHMHTITFFSFLIYTYELIKRTNYR